MPIKKSRGKNGTRLHFMHRFASRVVKVGFHASEAPFSHFLGQLISRAITILKGSEVVI